MKIQISDLNRFKVQCFDARGNSRDYAAVSSMERIKEQIAEAAKTGHKTAVIYTVSEIRTTDI